VDPRARMDDVEKRKFFALPGLELRPFGRPARSQSLYRLRYPSSLVNVHTRKHTERCFNTELYLCLSSTYVSEKHIASDFKVEVYNEQETSVKAGSVNFQRTT
jgi:hypothetical protein